MTDQPGSPALLPGEVTTRSVITSLCDCCEREQPVTFYRDGTALCDECITALTGGVSA